MELWFTERHTPHVQLSIRVERQLYSGYSEFQRIDIFDSQDFGRFLILDGKMMLTERDEFIYHEMISHVPMAVHPKAERVLVIGAGDGGVVRELVRYNSIKHIDLVELDPLVVEVCREFLPFVAGKLDDERVHIHYQDGLKFVRGREDEYDIIIVDSTNPFGPGEDLFTREFYGSCYKALKSDGILVNQQESAFYDENALAMQRAHKHVANTFPLSRIYQAHIPTYPSGSWLWGFASKKYHPIKDLRSAEWQALGIKTKYYTTKLHEGAFALPAYVEEMLSQVIKA